MLAGADTGAALVFAEGADGIRLSSDNRLATLRLETSSPDQRAIDNYMSVTSLGTLELSGLTARSRVEILARDNVRS